MKDKINGKTLALVNLIRNSKGKVLIFFFIIPILFLIVFFNLLEMNQSNLFFMIIFLLNYYIAVFILILIFAKIITTNIAEKPILRIVKKANTTHVKELWDEYKQPLRHLVVAEIGVCDGEYSKKIIQFLNIKQLVLVRSMESMVVAPLIVLASKIKTTFFMKIHIKKLKICFQITLKLELSEITL